jgi:hypothetical protein
LQEAINKNMIQTLRSLLRLIVGPLASRSSRHTIYEFESLATANKRDHLARYPIADLFVPFLDTELRNGIGHHAARYDSQSDSVICVKAVGSKLQLKSVPYTEFCRKVISIVSRLSVVETYLDSAITALGGKIEP